MQTDLQLLSCHQQYFDRPKAPSHKRSMVTFQQFPLEQTTDTGPEEMAGAHTTLRWLPQRNCLPMGADDQMTGLGHGPVEQNLKPGLLPMLLAGLEAHIASVHRIMNNDERQNSIEWHRIS